MYIYAWINDGDNNFDPNLAFDDTSSDYRAYDDHDNMFLCIQALIERCDEGLIPVSYLKQIHGHLLADWNKLDDYINGFSKSEITIPAASPPVTEIPETAQPSTGFYVEDNGKVKVVGDKDFEWDEYKARELSAQEKKEQEQLGSGVQIVDEKVDEGWEKAFILTEIKSVPTVPMEELKMSRRHVKMEPGIIKGYDEVPPEPKPMDGLDAKWAKFAGQ